MWARWGRSIFIWGARNNQHIWVIFFITFIIFKGLLIDLCCLGLGLGLGLFVLSMGYLQIILQIPSWSESTLLTIKSVCNFYTLFSIHFLWCQQGEFKASSAVDHFHYSRDLDMLFRGDVVRRNYIFITLKGQIEG